MMPITNLRLKNFKSFADSGDIRLAPLTLIFGRNNTGKSSLLQSLLLLRQAIESAEEPGRLNIRGPLYQANSYLDIVHSHDASRRIAIAMTLETPSYPIEMELEFASGEPHPPRLTRIAFDAQRGALSLEIHRAPGHGGPLELKIGDQNIGNERKANFFFSVNSILPRIGPGSPEKGRGNGGHERARQMAREAIREFSASLMSLRAVGAFRQQPERRYDYQGRTPPDFVDATGRNVVYALYEDGIRRRKKKVLLTAVNKWLRDVGRVRLMPIRVISKNARIFELRLKDTDSGRWANFADVGFGIGQALPVIVEGLRTHDSGLFIVQEPEIHLHPDAQLRMADFLASLVKSGRRVIVETHSEHILLRVRNMVIKKQLSPDQVSLIYVDKHKRGSSRAEQLEMDKLGQVRDWPADFMEEANEERLAIMEGQASHVEGG